MCGVGVARLYLLVQGWQQRGEGGGGFIFFVNKRGCEYREGYLGKMTTKSRCNINGRAEEEHVGREAAARRSRYTRGCSQWSTRLAIGRVCRLFSPPSGPFLSKGGSTRETFSEINHNEAETDYIAEVHVDDGGLRGIRRAGVLFGSFGLLN